MNVLQQRLAELRKNSGGSSDDLFWKPSEGENLIRLVPYVHDPEYGFVDMYFHYRVAERTLTSPLAYGDSDPMDEFAHRLKNLGGKENMKLYNALKAKERYYAPIVVRGQENKGVVFYAFGKSVLRTFLQYLTTPDWGDVRHPVEGRDLIVKYNKKPANGQSYPETTILFKPNTSPISTDSSIMEAIKNVPDLKNDIFGKRVPSYGDLMEYTYAYLRKTMTPDQMANIGMDQTIGRTNQDDQSSGVNEVHNSGYQPMSTTQNQPMQPPQQQPIQQQPPQNPPQNPSPSQNPPQSPQGTDLDLSGGGDNLADFQALYDEIRNSSK